MAAIFMPDKRRNGEIIQKTQIEALFFDQSLICRVLYLNFAETPLGLWTFSDKKPPLIVTFLS